MREGEGEDGREEKERDVVLPRRRRPHQKITLSANCDSCDSRLPVSVLAAGDRLGTVKWFIAMPAVSEETMPLQWNDSATVMLLWVVAEIASRGGGRERASE